MKFYINKNNKLLWIAYFVVKSLFIPQAQATQVKGIKMSSIGNSKKTNVLSGASAEDKKHEEQVAKAVSLLDLIETGRRKITKNVEYENVSINLASPTQEDDTDLEPFEEVASEAQPLKKRRRVVKEEKFFSSRVFNTSRHKKPKSTKDSDGKVIVKQPVAAWELQAKYLHDNNYISVNNVAYYDHNATNLPTQLSLDARVILEAESNPRSKNSTAIFCIVLRDKYGYLKRFAFHNHKDPMSGAIRSKAQELGYDIIQAEQSHAEGQFLQFLYKRNNARPGHYTHIVGMGCSKKHCIECDALLRLFLGPNYHDITASVNHKQEKDNTNPKHISTYHTLKNQADMSMKLSYIREVDFHVVQKQDAVDATTAMYNRYYLPDFLKDAIKNLTGNRTLDLSAERFTNIENKKIEESQRVEKLQEKITGLIAKRIKKYNQGQELENLIAEVIQQLVKKRFLAELDAEEPALWEYCKEQFEAQKAAKNNFISLRKPSLES
jgi:hypothetical protein